LVAEVRHPKFIASLIFTSALAAVPAAAQERPYFVTYDHYLEEPGSLEIALAATTGLPKDGTGYSAPWVELEYGVTGWWTTELYFEGVVTTGQGSAFTGWRWENRFRPLAGEHRLNPVLYVEYEHVNEASRIQKEIVGSGAIASEPIAELRPETAHELEGKLILSSAIHGWNVAENVVFEKNLSENEGVELGYSVGVFRSIGGLARGMRCLFCRENFVIGTEVYGGLGSTADAGLRRTRHFVAPAVSWRTSSRSALKASVGFGLTDESENYLLRVGWAYELPGWGIE
jgi:hypothetical protein